MMEGTEEGCRSNHHVLSNQGAKGRAAQWAGYAPELLSVLGLVPPPLWVSVSFFIK